MAFREEGRAWFSANVPKDWVQRRNAEESMEARFAYLRAWQRKMFDAGWAGISWPKEYGGRGAPPVEPGNFTPGKAPPPDPPLRNVPRLGVSWRTIISSP